MIDKCELDIVIEKIIRPALSEDLGTFGDVTTAAIFPAGTKAKAIIRAKESGVLAGSYLVEPIFAEIDKMAIVKVLLEDGAKLSAGTVIAEVEGSIHTILSGERLVLNLLQRLCGIASATSHLVNLVDKTGARLLDTRKTIPNLRQLEKAAVLAGGGCNHRFGLFDMILIKDTHVKAAGGPGAAVLRAKDWLKTSGRQMKIEVEVQSVEEFADAVSARPDRIMLDNMSCEAMKICVDQLRISGLAIETEASGNISETTIRAVAETGVDFISVGSLTHSVKALDIHLVLV